MDDTSRNSIQMLCTELVERKGQRVLALDLRKHCSWTDFMIIATASSRVHMQGMAAAVRETMRKASMEARGGKKTSHDSWMIIDAGNVVVSLMDSETREFYSLEELWYEAEIVYSAEDQSSSSS